MSALKASRLSSEAASSSGGWRKTAQIARSLNYGLEIQNARPRIARIRRDTAPPTSQGHIRQKSQRRDNHRNGADRSVIVGASWPRRGLARIERLAAPAYAPSHPASEVG